MITNLIASLVVTLVTNITTTDNAVYEQIPNPCPDRASYAPGWSCLVYHGSHNGAKIKEATEKTETAVVKEITSAEFNWGAEKKTVPLSEKILSTTATIYKKVEDWKYVSRAEVEPPKPDLFFTNGIGLMGLATTNGIIFGGVTITNAAIK